MKNFVKHWLVNFALIVICINSISFVLYQNWGDVSFIFELLFVTLLIRLMQMLTNKFATQYPILEYLLELLMVVAVVLACGWLFGWYRNGEIWFILGTIAVVYAAAYVLDLTRTRRDVAYINEQIKQRSQRKAKWR